MVKILKLPASGFFLFPFDSLVFHSHSTPNSQPFPSAYDWVKHWVCIGFELGLYWVSIGFQLGFGNVTNLEPPIKKNTAPVAPTITATGNAFYCPLSQTKIVATVTITHDPTEIGIEAIAIQIASGYIFGEDQLSLSNPLSHPTIKSSWNTLEGKLILSSPVAESTVKFSDLEAAIKDIVYFSSNPNPLGTRNFSITLGSRSANYLPSNGHYYEYVPSSGITWTNAKAAAELKTFYGLKGYLATLTAADEAQLSGKQAPGTGWIGGTDEETEGVWKWVTGPEAGTIFWNGTANGNSPNFDFWNTNEPNQSGDEDYAHITAPGVGIPGSWNDLSNTGATSGNYQPKGYIVEYGGMPGEPNLQLSASTTLTIAKILTTSAASRCDTGSITLNATASIGSIDWFDIASGGSIIDSGNNFTTPFLSSTKNYYAEVSGCTSTRTVIAATINTTPTISTTKPIVPRCGTGTLILEATPSIGNVNWFYETNGGTLISSGTTFTTPSLSTNTFFYAEANNNGCVSPNRISISTIINPVPEVTDENLILCQNSNLTLDATINGMTYLWSSMEITKTINVTSPGNYNVAITNSFPCTSIKNITVVENEIPEIKSINIVETNIEIIPKNQQPYFEYSIDGVTYFSSPQFTITEGGLYTAYIREIHDCGYRSKNFVVVSTPRYFTPNNDGINDFWSVKGLQYYPKATTVIFDRNGQLITTLTQNNHVWDGTFHNEKLPSTDYWFIAEIPETQQIIKGHFSLIR